MSSQKFDFEQDFELVRKNILSLCVEWDFYKSLYSNEQNVKILNKSASFFFSKLQIMLIDGITLKIGNLLDRKETFGNPNLSFDYLFDNIPTKNIYYSETKYYATTFSDGQFLARKYSCINPIQHNIHSGFLVKIKYWCSDNRLEEQLENLKEKFKPLKEYRNKNLGHFDLKTAQKNKNYMPLDVFDILSDIIVAMDRLMNRIEVYYNNSNTAYDNIIIQNGTNHLIADLMRSIRYKELLKDQLIDKYDYQKNIDRLKSDI